MLLWPGSSCSWVSPDGSLDLPPYLSEKGELQTWQGSRMLSLAAYLWWGYCLIILACDVSLPDIVRKIPILTGRMSTYLIAFFCYFGDEKTTSLGGLPLFCALVAQSCPVFCDPRDCSLPGSLVHGILHARILEWVAIPFRVSSWPRDLTWVSWIAGRFFTIWATREDFFVVWGGELWPCFCAPPAVLASQTSSLSYSTPEVSFGCLCHRFQIL